MFILEYSVRGAMTIHERTCDTFDEAKAKADRWGASNSTGHYWACVLQDGLEVYKVNLPNPEAVHPVLP